MSLKLSHSGPPEPWGIPSPVYEVRKTWWGTRRKLVSGGYVWFGQEPPKASDYAALSKFHREFRGKRKGGHELADSLSIVGRKNPKWSTFSRERSRRNG